MVSVIEDWHMLVVEMHAEAKNKSVIAMYSDFQKGTLKEGF